MYWFAGGEEKCWMERRKRSFLEILVNLREQDEEDHNSFGVDQGTSLSCDGYFQL